LIAALLKIEGSLIDAFRDDDLRQAEGNNWIERFLAGGKRIAA
jgi:hypothetical protein